MPAGGSKTLTYLQTVKALVRLGLPVLVTQLGTILVGFADTLMIGKYGTDELAAAAFVNNLFMVPLVMQIGFAGGITPLVGALYGRRDAEGVGRTMRMAVRLNTVMALLLTFVMGIMFFFLDKMGQDASLLPLIRPYYLLVLVSLMTGGIFCSCMQVSNGVNDTSTPMWVILGANLLNIGGNYILIFGTFGAPELGLTGAGASTLASRVLAAVVLWLILIRSRRFAAYRSGYNGGGESKDADMRLLFSTSWPLMFQAGVECFLWAFAAVVSGWFGKHQLAAYQVVLTVNQLGFMTYMSVGTAVSIRVANFAGVQCREGMRMTAKAGLHLSLLLGAVASVIFILGGEQIVELFTSDVSVIVPATMLIAPLVLYQFGDAAQITYGNALRGTSNVKPMFGISVVCYLVVGISVMLILSKGLAMEGVGVYYSFSAAVFLAAVLYGRWFRKTIER